jgi:hypothetical protein
MSESNSTDLTAGRLRELLHYDPETGVFTWRVPRGNVKAGDVAGKFSGDGYRQVCVCGRFYYAHRLAWFYIHGVWPEAEIDHRNRDRSDNRMSNLRPVSRAENKQNSKVYRGNSSGFKGVAWSDRHRAWVARIWSNKRVTHLGRFPSINDAIAARKAAEAKYHTHAAT